MFLLLMILIFQSGFVPAKTYDSEKTLLEVIYWEVKPFIFTNEEGKIDGIIPMMLTEAQYYCMKNKTNVKFSLEESSRESFYNLLQSDVRYGNGRLKNISQEKVFWGPVLAKKDKRMKEIEKRQGVESMELMKSGHIAVIIQRSKISLPNRLFSGISNCKQIFLLAFLLSGIISVTMWLVEHSSNEAFPNSFFSGTFAAFWWSMVSMTTVGYGDCVPKTTIGRSIAVIWLFIGVLITCVMTATLTDFVSGQAGFNIRAQTVSTIENSYEETVARDIYRANVIPTRSYDEAVEKVRRGDSFAALINADVAAWYQEKFHNDSSDNPLRVVDILPANIYVSCYIPRKKNKQLEHLFTCMHKQQEEIQKTSIENFKRYCHKEVLYIGSMSEFMKNNIIIQALMWIICGAVVLGLIYEVYRCIWRKQKKRYPNNKSCFCKKFLHKEKLHNNDELMINNIAS